MPKENKKVQRKGTLFGLGFSSSRKEKEEEKSKKDDEKRLEKIREARQRYETHRKPRTFNEAWKEEYTWLLLEDGKMFCSTCLAHPTLADPTGKFVVGTDNMKVDTVQAHNRSKKHIDCAKAEARDQDAQPVRGPIDIGFERMKEDEYQLMVKMFNTAYGVAKEEMPFTNFRTLLRVQKKNGTKLGEGYDNDKACREFVKYIFKDMLSPHMEALASSKYIAVLADSSTDTSTKDLESVYVRYLKDGAPTSTFLTIEELELVTGEGHKNAIVKALDNSGFDIWKEKLVAFGSDGAACMMGNKTGASTLLHGEFPHLLSIHCMAHRLELGAADVVRNTNDMKSVTDMCIGIYKQYHYSPKAWRELQEMAEMLDEALLKPTNLGGTRWIPHMSRALKTVMFDFKPLCMQLENCAAAKTSSPVMQGRARNVSQQLKDYRSLLYIHLIMDVLECLTFFSLKLQQDNLDLPGAVRALETAHMALLGMELEPGDHLYQFLQDIEREGDNITYKGVELKGVRANTLEVFNRDKPALLEALRTSLDRRFSSLEQVPVLKAASRIMDPREWPEEDRELAAFGRAELATITDHFRAVLVRNQCDVDKVREEWTGVKAWVRRRGREEYRGTWRTLMMDPQLSQEYANILHVIEIILVIPFSTAAVERGFSTMKRIKSDWRSSLEVSTLRELMYISIHGPSIEDYEPQTAIHRWWDEAERKRRIPL